MLRCNGLHLASVSDTDNGAVSPAASIAINCSELHSERGFWDAYVQAAQPRGTDFFGRNLDASWDALHGGPGFPETEEVRFTATGSLAALRNGNFLSALREIADSSTWVRIVIEE